MSFPLRNFILLILAFLTGCVENANAREFPIDLEWGKYRVGFKSEIVLDHSRTYSTEFDESSGYGVASKQARPIVVNLWYPAVSDESVSQTPVKYRSYLELRSGQKDVQDWADSLSKYAANVISQEFFQKPVAELDELELDTWNRFLDQPTRAFKDAEPHDGLFPVVVYHSGAGSSFEDNSLFSEFLASSGFVVIGSAYPAASGESFNVDGKAGSVRDMEFLARYAKELEFANWNQICFAGHSLGAQVSLLASTRPDCPASVLMLLDTTVDYYSLATPTFKYLTTPVLENLEYIDQPMFVATGKGALFQMCDRLVNSERTYLTIPKLNHNEYISQGIFRLQVLEWLTAERPDEKIEQELKGADRVRSNYVALCHLCRTYLNDQLNGQKGNFEEASKAYTEQHDRNHIAIESMGFGESNPEPYLAENGKPPTPRELVRLLESEGVDWLCEQLSKYKKSHSESPIFENNMLMSAILYDLAIAERLEDARQLHRHMKKLGSNGVSTLRFLAFICEHQKRLEMEQHFLDIALSIDPSDKITLQKIEALDSRKNSKKTQNLSDDD